jgi:hypothetical protein
MLPKAGPIPRESFKPALYLSGMTAQDVKEKFTKTLTYGWMKRFLDRHKSKVSWATVMPQEQVRLEVPRSHPDDYLSLIKGILPTVPMELIFNLNETGLLDCQNRKSKPFLFQLPKKILHFTIL